jgi:hypothetical protein
VLAGVIFNGKPINEITDDEIARLVAEHFAERQHLELKLTVNHRDDAERLEVLLDVSSLANGGGGYLIVGIRDDGRGRAQRFEKPGDTRQIAQSIYDLSMRWIDERIAGLEVHERNVQGNALVIVRAPVSARTPHMVTFGDKTFFYSRYETGKRAMTLAEIREMMLKTGKADEAAGLLARLVGELQYNADALANITWATAPSLRDELWRGAGARMEFLPGDLWTAIDGVYRHIRAARDIHETIRSAPAGANTMPEHIRMEEILELAKRETDLALQRLRGI